MPPRRPLTPRQEVILNCIKNEVRIKGYPPSVREIGHSVGLTSSSSVHTQLRKLEEKGYIRRDPTKPRAIEVLNLEETNYRAMVRVPLLGNITAGRPMLAAENLEAIYPFSQELVRQEGVFMLRVQGESMIGAGIFNGDLVLVRPQVTAKNGDIVVALLGEEATVKRFFRDKKTIRLQPENPSMEPIISRDVTILGRVIGLFRHF